MANTTRNADREAVADRLRLSRDGERDDRGSRHGDDFESFAATFRRALLVSSPLESILADRLILAAWRLQLASAVEFDTALAGEELAPLSRESFDAENSLGKALELLESSRAARLARYDRPAADPAEGLDQAERPGAPNPYPCAGDDLDDLSNEWPTLPDDARAPDEADDSVIAPRWQDRLVFDFNVSETSPVVKGTWVTVGHVVSLIVDGWNWSDVLRTHPELTEDDIRTCLSYTVEQDDGGILEGD